MKQRLFLLVATLLMIGSPLAAEILTPEEKARFIEWKQTTYAQASLETRNYIKHLLEFEIAMAVEVILFNNKVICTPGISKQAINNAIDRISQLNKIHQSMTNDITLEQHNAITKVLVPMVEEQGKVATSLAITATTIMDLWLSDSPDKVDLLYENGCKLDNIIEEYQFIAELDVVGTQA